MTKQGERALQANRASFDERVEILARELELAVKWQRPCVVLVVYGSEYVRADVETALGNHLFDLGQSIVHLRTKNRENRDVMPFFKEFKDPTHTVFLLDGFRWANADKASIYSTLDLQRQYFLEQRIRVVFWLTHNEIVDLAHAAPDFWAHRSRVIEFVESPKAEQLLQQALESAWQGTGEYAGEYADTDAKISHRESMLTDMPRGEEASSIRANLLLTLGILNWRKGDFEKADEGIHEALQIATRIRDTWLEAQCFNALALIRSSTQQIDEAIDAYKQAIHLAPDQIFAWNNMGNLCSRIGRNDEAMIAFEKALQGNPRDSIAWNGLAGLHFKVGYIDEAIAAYGKAVQYMPTFAQPWCDLGDVYASVGRADAALQSYSNAIQLNQEYVAPWLRLGMLLSKQGRYPEASEAYQRALALEPRNSNTWNELGLLHLQTEALDEAERAFSNAIELDRGHGWAHSNLASTYMKQGKHKRTISLFLRSIELLTNDKDKAIAWDRLANAYRCLRDEENAMAAYQMADKLDPALAASRPDRLPKAAANQDLTAEREHPLAQARSASVPPVSASAGDNAVPEPAVSPSQPTPARVNARRIPDPPAWLRNGLGNEKAQKQQPDGPSSLAVGEQESQTLVTGSKSIDAVESQSEGEMANSQIDTTNRAEPTESMDAVKWNERGNAAFTEGSYVTAIEAYNKAIQLDPSFGVPYSNLALTYLTQGQSTEAILLYQKSIELLDSDTDKALSWNGLGNCYRCLDDYANAVTAYQKAAELDPETSGIRDRADDFQVTQAPKSAQAWNDLGEVFLQAGSAVQAIDAFQKAIEIEPGFGLSYGNLGRALAAQNQYHDALPLFQKSIELSSDDKEKASAWNGLGNVYRKLNDYDNAISAYQKAVVLADEGVDVLTRARFSLLSNCYVDQ